MPKRTKGLGRKTEEIGKGNQMTAMRFLPGVGVIRHPQPPFGAQGHEKMFQTTFNLHAYDKCYNLYWPLLYNTILRS